MTLPIVERARARLAGRDDLLALVDDAVVARFELMPGEIKVLAALLLADGNLLEAHSLAGTSQASFGAAFDNLVARGLVKHEKGVVSLEPMQQQLKVELDHEAEKEEGIPQPVIVFRSVPEQVAALARSSNNGPQALGRVYAFLFGKRVKNFPILGRYVKEFGSASRAARFLLEHMLDDFGGQDPLTALLPLAVATGSAIRAGGWRSDNAPDLEEQRAEIAQADEVGWRNRMRRWLNEGTLEHNLANIDQAEDASRTGHYFPPLSKEQAEMDRRQVKLDFERWNKAGRPNL